MADAISHLTLGQHVAYIRPSL